MWGRQCRAGENETENQASVAPSMLSGLSKVGRTSETLRMGLGKKQSRSLEPNSESGFGMKSREVNMPSTSAVIVD